MSIAKVFSRAQIGVNAPLVTIEVHLSSGLPSISIVGLPETEVKESRDRVRSAIINSRFEFPIRRITINLAPADLPKEGGRFDLPIALGVLAASQQIPATPLESIEFVGELALTGELRAIRGVLPCALQAQRAGHDLVVPHGNANEAALVNGLSVFPARHLLEVCAHINRTQPLLPYSLQGSPSEDYDGVDFSDVRSQHHAKRALEIAAAGGHNLLMVGPPGTGKSMLARRLPSILPPMTEAEALESAAVASVSHHGFQVSAWRQRPFRAPHHTASGVALVGGGSHPRPGEISLAHHGVLFLDELPEFDRRVLEVLREPIEAGMITVSRAAQQADFPARFQLIAAMNPCPCGYLGDRGGRCHCTSEQVKRYRTRISGPLLDRIDMTIEVPNVPHEVLLDHSSHAESSASVRERVCAARARQVERCGKPNSQLTNKGIDRYCRLTEIDTRLLGSAIDRLGFSARSAHRILKVARTIADLEPRDDIQATHLTEAISYRRLERPAR
ncbi:MAG: YifB family Mg chelatase-like AAA ATPase [Pseudomonadota bacterium]|nr:YifB family Mg chelatase-like AAA ATPase [Pseudomonadota bacterium]